MALRYPYFSALIAFALSVEKNFVNLVIAISPMWVVDLGILASNPIICQRVGSGLFRGRVGTWSGRGPDKRRPRQVNAGALVIGSLTGLDAGRPTGRRATVGPPPSSVND